MLVDDDKLVTKFMEKMIPWEESGFKVAASFQDSEKALEYLQRNPYDVLITDIGMPRMNGIELLTRLKEEDKLQKNIILSCHDEFHYAQQALKLNAYDYILKESMEEEHIIELLEKLKEKLDESSQNNKYELKVAKFLKTNNSALKAQFLEKIIHEPVLLDDDWWEEQAELLEINFSHEGYTVVLSYIDQFEKAIEHYETETLLQFSINNILEEVLEKHGSDIRIFYLHNKFFLIFPRGEKRQLEVQQEVERAVNEMHSKLDSFLGITLTTILEPEVEEREEMVHSIQKLLHHEEQRFYYAYGSIQKFRFLSYNNQSIFEAYMDTLQQLKTIILNKQEDKINSFIENQVEKIVNGKFPPKMVKDWALKLMLDIKLSLNAITFFEDQPFNNMTSKLIQEAENYQALEKVLKKMYHQFMEQAPSSKTMSQNEDVINAQKYVRTHLDEKVSLKDIAAYLHLNPSYFSRLFKKETGESFIEFVTRVKMEKAMDLLDNTTKPVDQIAYELGFDSNSYFLKTFKKTTGMSPKAYKFKTSAEMERLQS